MRAPLPWIVVALAVVTAALAQISPATKTKLGAAAANVTPLATHAAPASSPAALAAAALARPPVTAGIASAKVQRIAPDRATLTIAPKSDTAGKLALLDATGKEVPTTRGADGSLQAVVDPRQGYLLAETPPPLRALPKEGVHFPVRYVTITPTGETRLGGLFLQPVAVPLTWQDDVRAYATELVVGYEFEDGVERDMPKPKTVAFFVEGSHASVRADTVTISKSGTAGFQRVSLTSRQLEGETRIVARAGPADEFKSSVTLRREPGGLQLSLPSTELPGFGVGSVALTVSLLARDGMPMAAPEKIEVQLSSRGLRPLEPAVIEEGKTSGRVEVRTTGIGPDEIVARSGAFVAALPIKLVFPVAPIVAALAGGALGGTGRYLRNRRKRGALLGRRVVEGMLVGVIVVGAAWAGLVAAKFGTGVFGTPFGAFVLATLSGYLGCVVLDVLAKKTFPGAKSEAA